MMDSQELAKGAAAMLEGDSLLQLISLPYFLPGIALLLSSLGLLQLVLRRWRGPLALTLMAVTLGGVVAIFGAPGDEWQARNQAFIAKAQHQLDVSVMERDVLHRLGALHLLRRVNDEVAALRLLEAKLSAAGLPTASAPKLAMALRVIQRSNEK